jgi:hypothetical protein
MGKDLNIITLNIPCPPDYGGMIDSWFRIAALSKIGISIHLHCFEYGRNRLKNPDSLCTEVHYYSRDVRSMNLISVYPYTVRSRRSDELINNLLGNNYPILFDALHTTYYLGHKALRDRRKFVRLHNIEHRYYNNLAAAEKNLFKKSYYTIEALKLKSYEGILANAEIIFPISYSDNKYFAEKYKKSELILPFHQFDNIISKPGTGTYILYHGDLSINENDSAAIFLTDEVFSKIGHSCIIAGKNPSRRLLAKAAVNPNIRIIQDPDNDTMTALIRNAHITVLTALTLSGFRIKLLSSLFAGRYCLVNNNILHGTGLDGLCEVAGSGKEFIEKINSLITIPFTDKMIKEREKVLLTRFDNLTNAGKIAEIIFPDNPK